MLRRDDENIIITEIDSIWNANNGFKDKLNSWLAQVNITKHVAVEAKQCFHQWRPLAVYVRAGNGARKGIASFSLRFLGQEVASLIVQDNDVYLNISDKIARTNKRYFPNLMLYTGRYAWRGREAQHFRRYFKNTAKSNMAKLHSPEHKIESRIIEEMCGKSKNKFGGIVSGIQPVTLSGFPLQFPLPISGSSGTPKATNGHMDILARRRSGRICLSIWELKAPGRYKNTLREVYIYSVTLLKMLRDPELGQEWYEVFGFSGKIPVALRIEAVVVITEDQRRKLERENAQHNLPQKIGNDIIEFYAAYYDENTLNINFERICNS